MQSCAAHVQLSSPGKIKLKTQSKKKAPKSSITPATICASILDRDSPRPERYFLLLSSLLTMLLLNLQESFVNLHPLYVTVAQEKERIVVKHKLVEAVVLLTCKYYGIKVLWCLYFRANTFISS